jgi:DNA invertase Pin-like site-specific DNA recombinase
MNCAIYCRVSTDDQDAGNQERICREYCERTDHKIFRVYVDVISGKTTSRPEFDLMLKDMREWKFNCVMVTKLDRIGRSLKHILSLFDEFKLKGVQFIATTQNIDTSNAAGQLQMQIIGAFAEFERNIISERTKEALKYAENVGKRGKDKKLRKQRGVSRRAQLHA